MKAAIVKLTPQLALQYLLKNKNNRPLSSKVDVYANDMKEGRWKENGESIIIDKNGHIKDGQHRLTATVRADYTWNVPIVSDVDPDVMDTIDTGKNRSLSDVLKIEGYYSPNVFAAITIKMIYFDWGWTTSANSGGKRASKKQVTNKIGLNYAKEHRKMITDITKLANRLYERQLEKIHSRSDIGLFIYIITRGHGIDNPFIEKFLNLVIGYETDNNSATTWYFKKLFKYKQGKDKVSRRWKIGIFIKCWNLYINGNPPVKSVQFKIDDPLPKVEELETQFT